MRALHGLGIVALCGLAGSCFWARSSKGGGQVSRQDAAKAGRQSANPHDVELPAGYTIEVVAEGLTFPTGVAFGDRGEIYVVESGYAYGETLTTARIVRVRERGGVDELVTASGSAAHAPWNGIAFHGGALLIAQGGALDGGRIVRYPIEGERLGAPRVIVDNLPSLGDHHTNGPAVSRDGWIYFGQGTATNSAVVGVDNHDFGWLARRPTFHDIPCQDVTLSGVSFTSKNPLTAIDDEATTGAYRPFGTPARAGEVIAGSLPCSGAIMRVPATGGDVELVAWGLRNPFGLAFDPAGQLYATDNGADVRGSRPVFGAADVLWKIEQGAWYGWPDFIEGRPAIASWYSEAGGDTKGFMLATHPQKPPEPAAYLPVHAAVTGIDFSRERAFGHVGEAFVTLFGDMAPAVGKVMHPVGFAVMRVDPRTGAVHHFARNKPDAPGPASKREHRGLERPIAARFSPDGRSLYVVDFGVMRVDDSGPRAIEKSGALWRITREASHAAR
jgi:glucose/arabinose dehydrogenase